MALVDLLKEDFSSLPMSISVSFTVSVRLSLPGMFDSLRLSAYNIHSRQIIEKGSGGFYFAIDSN
jgi:hypothetical protein